MNKIIIVSIFIMSVILANLSANKFGIWVTPINAFFLIGLEIVVRDLLHDSLTKLETVIVVVVAGFFSYVINAETESIALASVCALTISYVVDYIVFKKSKGTWLYRCNKSNVYSSMVDSLIFPTVAFGVFNIWVIILQFTLKVFGGAMWSLIFNKFRKF